MLAAFCLSCLYASEKTGWYSYLVRFCSLGICLSLAFAVQGADQQVSMVVAVAERESSCALLGYYRAGAFEVAEKMKRSDPDWFSFAADEVLKSFRIGEVLVGVDQTGRQRSAVVKRIEPNPDIGSSPVEIKKDAWAAATIALLGQQPIPLRLLQPKRGRLSAALDRKLRDAVKVLFAKHLEELPPDSRPGLEKILDPELTTLREAPRALIVRYPLALVREGESSDDTSQAFFIVDLPTQRIVRGEFGHQEWSSRSTVLTIIPEMYFRLGGSPRIYFLAEYATGWEDIGRHAIFELGTGREVMQCH